MTSAGDDASVQEYQRDAAVRRARGEFVRGVSGFGTPSAIPTFRQSPRAITFSSR
jgi:hypothetical protein